MIRSLQVYRVAIEVLVEASTVEEAHAIAERAQATMDESELWSAEVGPASLAVEETRELRRRNGLPAEDLRGWGVREDMRY